MEKILENPMVKKAMENTVANNLEQLPPETRAKLQALMQKFGGGSAGQPAAPTYTTVSQSAPTPSVSVSTDSQDWKQSYSLEEPKSISAKTLFFAMAALFGMIIFVFVAWIFFHAK